ncbi:hypothetical protein ABT354_13815 [Streptomyces sp. NPDC000594]
MGGLQDRWGFRAEEVVLSAGEQSVIAELALEEERSGAVTGAPEEG